MKRRVGVDLGAGSPHTAVVVEENGKSSKPVTIDVSLAGYEKLVELAMGGAERCQGEVVMEATGNVWLPLTAFLNSRGVPVVLGPGKKVSDLRKFYRRYAKTDSIDAEAMGRLPEVDPKGSCTFELPPVEVLTLRRLVKERERFVRLAAVGKVRIHALLQLANPALMDSVGEEKFSGMARIMFRHFLDPSSVAKLGVKRFRQALRRRGARVNEETVDAIFAACEKSSALYEDMRRRGMLPFDYPLLTEEASGQLALIEFAEGRVASLEAVIDERYQRFDSTQTLRQIPGIGPTIAPAIEALSSPISRFRNAKSYASYCGLVPRKSKSGKSDHQGLRITKASHRLLKKYYYLAAEIARRNDPQLAAYYAKHRAAGWHHERIVIAIAHALVRRVYALLKRREEANLDGNVGIVPVRYDLRAPAGETLDRKAARAFIAEHYPSKREQARRLTQRVKEERDASQLGNEGQPKGSTNRVKRDHVPPRTISQDPPSSHTTQHPSHVVEKPVDKMCASGRGGA